MAGTAQTLLFQGSRAKPGIAIFRIKSIDENNHGPFEARNSVSRVGSCTPHFIGRIDFMGSMGRMGSIGFIRGIRRAGTSFSSTSLAPDISGSRYKRVVRFPSTRKNRAPWLVSTQTI